MSELKDNNWIDKIKDLLGDTPKSKNDLIILLETAFKNQLLSHDTYQMILGVFSVSEIPVREIMIPRPHMITINVNEDLQTVINKVINDVIFFFIFYEFTVSLDRIPFNFSFKSSINSFKLSILSS